MQTATRSNGALRARLLPLYIAVALQGFGLWVPIEKLFLADIGFDAAAVGLMAAAYAAVVPVVEVPSGILADRWSRRGVLMIASAALAVSVLIGGLSANVGTYIVGALFLGVYFAMYSGTLDAIVYDTVVEETGESEDFERRIGRVRLVESASFVSSALVGGWLAELTSTRLTYFLSVPFVVLSIVVLARFDEPRLHRTGERTSLRRHIAMTYRTLGQSRRLVSIVALATFTAVIIQGVFEFGPLWMVALAVPAVAWGPYWAGLVSSLGLGGLLAGRLHLDRWPTMGGFVALMVVAAWLPTWSTNVAVLMAAQIGLVLLAMVASIHVTALLHDSVPSTVRTGVASGVGAITWMVFLPFALVFGRVADDHSAYDAGWLIFGIVVAAAALLVAVARRRPVDEPAVECSDCLPEPVAAAA